MEIRYERDMIHAYMVLPCKKERGYSSRMLCENRIDGFLPVQMQRQEEKEEYYYRVSSQISLAEYLEQHPLSFSMLKQLVFTICQSAANMGEFLLAQEYLYLIPETIFVQSLSKDTESDETCTDKRFCFTLCIYPDEKQDLKEELRQLMQYLMGKADPQEAECAALCYDLYGRLQKENFCLREFMTAMEEHPSLSDIKAGEKKKWKKPLFAFWRNSGILSS